jgi:hypothetical protein
MEKNDGFINHGNVTATNIVNGANNIINATTTYQNADLQQLSVLFNVLFEKLQTSGEDVPNKADVLDAINDLKEEIKKPEPKKSILKALGKTVLDNLGYIKTLAPIAQSIWHHISSFIGSAAGV